MMTDPQNPVPEVKAATPKEIVSVNSRGGSSENLAGKVAFVVALVLILVMAGLFGFNKWRAAKKADAATIEKTSSEENKPAAVGARHHFDTDPPPLPGAQPSPPPKSDPTTPLPSASGGQACSDGQPGTVVIGADGKPLMSPVGLPMRVCKDGRLVVPALKTAGNEQPIPLASNNNQPGRQQAGGTPPVSRYAGDVVVSTSNNIGGAGLPPMPPMPPLPADPAQAMAMMQSLMNGGKTPAASSTSAGALAGSGASSAPGSIGSLLTPSSTPTSATDIDVTMVRQELMSIYIGIQPNRLADASLLINLFFSQLINLNTKELPADNPALKHQCLLILDEFTAIGRVGIIAKSVSFISGYNIRLLPIIQSISQLESVYGEKDTRTFVTNHALQILYPPREQKDANEYSAMLGYFTEKAVSTGTSRPNVWGNNNATNSENVSDQRRALLLPQELKELDEAKEILILENSKPILCEKARYYNDHTFIDRLKLVSPTLAGLGKKLPTQAQLEDVAFTRNELSYEVPKLDVDLHKAKMERRTRALAPGEPIDLAKLAFNVADLPALDDQETPSKESVVGVVNAFFSQLDGMNSETGEIAPVVTGSATQKQPRKKAIAESGDAANGQEKPKAQRRRAKPKKDAIDLAVLDH